MVESLGEPKNRGCANRTAFPFPIVAVTNYFYSFQDKCPVMHIGNNNMQSNYNMSNQQLPTTDQQWDLGIIITKDLKYQKQTEESCKTANRD